MGYIIQIKNDSGDIKTWAGKEFSANEEYNIPDDGNRQKWKNDSSLLTSIGNLEALVGDGSQYFTDVNKAINWLKGNIPSQVNIEGVKVDGERLQSMNNRVPNGYSLYITGVSDNLTTGSYGTGDDLLFDSSNVTKSFQLLNHYLLLYHI